MAITLPRLATYGPYSGNYGAHSMSVDIGALTVYFSYQTPIAFRTLELGLIVRQNEWGPTTAKHLKALGSQRDEDRLPGVAFERYFQEYLRRHGMAPHTC